MAESLIQKSLTQVVLGQYQTGPSTAILDPSILPQVQQYKRVVASQLAPIAREDIGRKIPDGPFLVSRKIDGEFTALVWRGGELFTVNPGGTVRIGLPFFDEIKTSLQAAKLSDAIIAGELYLDDGSDRRCRVHDVISVLRHPTDQAELNQIRFAIFDLISIDGAWNEQPYAQTWQRLEQIFAGGKGAHLVETTSVTSARDIELLFRDWVDSEMAEGIVVRSDTAGNFKLKPLFTIDAVVIGFTESLDDRSGLLHDLLLAVRRQDGAFHVLCRVGGGFSEQQRRDFLSDLKDMVVDSEYAEVNSDHVAYHMVRPQWVVEISCLDLVAQNTRGRPVNRMTLNWDVGRTCYTVIRRLPLASVISPQFLRIREDKSREDKSPSREAVRIQQIDDIVPVPMSAIDATELTLPRSQLLQREVYVKSIRGEKMVRKFLLWKTNKENEAENFPAFVVYHADFSPSRKVPLTREVRVSNSETQILALWHQLKEENIKQGWELHSDTGADIDKIVEQDAAAIKETPKKKSAKPAQKQPTKKNSAKSAGKSIKRPVKKSSRKDPES